MLFRGPQLLWERQYYLHIKAFAIQKLLLECFPGECQFSVPWLLIVRPAHWEISKNCPLKISIKLSSLAFFWEMHVITMDCQFQAFQLFSSYETGWNYKPLESITAILGPQDSFQQYLVPVCHWKPMKNVRLTLNYYETIITSLK